MKSSCLHSLACAAFVVVTCFILVHADPQHDVSNVVKSDGRAVKSDTGFASPWWQAPLHVKWLPEVVIATFLVCYLANIWFGRTRNSEVAVAFAETFCTEGSLLDRNFSQVGPRVNGAMDLILRESMSKFNIYATGRRFCKSFQATLDLQHRQDLLYMACYLVSPRQDRIDIDIPMNENNMQPLVLVIATPRLAKELSKSLPDVQSFAHPISVEAKRSPQFPSDKLSVWAESSSVFYELMTDKVMDLLFGRAAFHEASKYFRYLHFSSENSEGFSKHSLKLSFDLPQKEQMQDFTKVLTAVLHLIDVSHCLVLYTANICCPLPTASDASADLAMSVFAFCTSHAITCFFHLEASVYHQACCKSHESVQHVHDV
jgi:hypothetical protein